MAQCGKVKNERLFENDPVSKADMRILDQNELVLMTNSNRAGGTGGAGRAAAPPQILPEVGVKPVSCNNLVLLRAPSDFLTFRRP